MGFHEGLFRFLEDMRDKLSCKGEEKSLIALMDEGQTKRNVD